MTDFRIKMGRMRNKRIKKSVYTKLLVSLKIYKEQFNVCKNELYLHFDGHGLI